MKYFITLVAAIILFSGFLVWYGVYNPIESSSDEEVIFLVNKGQGAKEISINLKEQNLIRYSSFFRVYVLITKQAGHLQAGEYKLSYSMDIPEIIAKFVSGDRIKKTITIIEGWTVKDIEEYLKKQGIVITKGINTGLEGYLFPDTYEIAFEDGIKEIIEMMLDNFGQKLSVELVEDIAFQRKTIPEIITMASLLEKEVRSIEDKKIISGILWKRLEAGMLLQVDAAMITYEQKGLPSDPICNPGLESIEAAIYPNKTEYWFYLSTPEGETIFSKTLKEHNQAIAKYLK